MPDWTSSMQQTFEYYTVDPGSWTDMKRITDVTSCTITRDAEVSTLGSATFDIANLVGECYIRVYLVTVQNGVTERFPLGTYLVQTPSSNYNGTMRLVSMDAYTPLLELKEGLPPLGYAIEKDVNIMEQAYILTRNHVRAPVIRPVCGTTLQYDFVADTDDNWLTFVSDLVENAKYRIALDDMGRVLFAPKQETASLQPVWTFNDDNASILCSEISMNHDLYGIPNVVEVVYSNGKDSRYARVVNNELSSPTSTVNRGREIVYRDTNPSLRGVVTPEEVEDYANRLLRELSSIEYTVTYTHAYCPVNIGDCVRINHSKAGLTDIKAKVISQNIKCEPGCPVKETAVFTAKLWR